MVRREAVGRPLLLAVVLTIVAAACATSEAAQEPTTTTPPPAIATSEETANVAAGNASPARPVAPGEPCPEAGRLGETSQGTPVLCSGTTSDGTVLDEPMWRETAARNSGAVVLDESEAAAVATAKALSPDFNSGGDHAVLIAIEEYAAASRMAAQADIPHDEGFTRLVGGYQVSNAVSYDESLTATVAVLEGALVLLSEDDPANAYIVDLLRWYRQESIDTYYGLVSKATPEQEQAFFDVYLDFGALDSQADVTLTAGYEVCAANSFGDPQWRAEEVSNDIETYVDSPFADVGETAFFLLALEELAVMHLCPRYGPAWEATKDLLASEDWYPTEAEFPAADERLGGLFR